jgi:hypothetical protein
MEGASMAEGSRTAGTSEPKVAEGLAAGEGAASNREAAVASTVVAVGSTVVVAVGSMVAADHTVVADMVEAIAKA